MRVIVGRIQGYDVIYIPEKHTIFCKNTAVPVDLITGAVYGNLDRYSIPEKNLVIRKDSSIIEFGCLRTTVENAKRILANIK